MSDLLDHTGIPWGGSSSDESRPVRRARERADAKTNGRVLHGLLADDRLTEAGAAERFARIHGADVRYDWRRLRWLLWQGHRWMPDDDSAVTRLGIEFSRGWQREALDLPDGTSAKPPSSLRFASNGAMP